MPEDNARSNANPRPLNAQITPRFAGPVTFYRLPATSQTADLDVPIVGLPYDTGASFRVGARFGPRAIREASTLLRPYNRILGVDPYERLRIDDIGDVTLSPYDPIAVLTDVDRFFSPLFAAGATPLSFGGDHSLTLPILRAAAKTHGPLAMVQFDSHLDTWGAYFGMEYTHGSFAIRAIEEGLIDPKASTQVAIRGMLFGPEDIRRSDDWGLRAITAEEMATRTMTDVAREVRERAETVRSI